MASKVIDLNWIELNFFYFRFIRVCVGREIVVNLPIEIHPRRFDRSIYLYRMNKQFILIIQLPQIHIIIDEL